MGSDSELVFETRGAQWQKAEAPRPAGEKVRRFMDELYTRKRVLHVDGAELFDTRESEQAEYEIARILEQQWKMEIRHFAKLATVDWYAVKYGRVIGVAELKRRSHAYGRYPTVFLAVRKWLALNSCAMGLNVPAIFVVQFTDQMRWQKINCIDASKMIFGGHNNPRIANDEEPLIEVPVGPMMTLEENPHARPENN